ncbi:MAG: hypothetical protein IIB87_02195 [Chloroflexi bacterium]|nr:hypothetical protein [Chloroflexota bacterium]
MVKEVASETQAGALGWTQDQIYQLKSQVAQLGQQLEQLTTMVTKTNDSLRTMATTLQEASLGASQTPRLQEEINQSAALIMQLLDQQAEADKRLDELGRRREVDEERDQQDWSEVAKRTEQLERQVLLWHDRQSGVDEVGRRFQEGLSLLRQQAQQMEQRLELAEGKAARGVEGANRAEHTLTQVEATILALQQEDEALTERSRMTADVVQRLEITQTENLEELKRLELLAERIELHRAERQRLEDRALRLEEELQDLQGRTENSEHLQGRLGGQQQGLSSRLDSLQEMVEEQRKLLVDQIRKLTGTQDRTKRRQIQELERELREMKQFVADLSRE